MLPLDVMAQAGVKEEDVLRYGAQAEGLRDSQPRQQVPEQAAQGTQQTAVHATRPRSPLPFRYDPNIAALESYAENTYSTLMYLTLSALPMTSVTADLKRVSQPLLIRARPCVRSWSSEMADASKMATGSFTKCLPFHDSRHNLLSHNRTDAAPILARLGNEDPWDEGAQCVGGTVIFSVGGVIC
jgi:hypothetical protein